MMLPIVKALVLAILLLGNLLGDIAKDDTLPPSGGGVALFLNVLQSFQVAEVDPVEAMLSGGCPGVSFGLDEVPKLQLNANKVSINTNCTETANQTNSPRS
jgi:hypothetical protein